MQHTSRAVCAKDSMEENSALHHPEEPAGIRPGELGLAVLFEHLVRTCALRASCFHASGRWLLFFVWCPWKDPSSHVCALGALP